MKALSISPLLLSLMVLPACPGSDEANPRVLWLALDGAETRVKLVDVEPHPF
jgi:hypothetical protein